MHVTTQHAARASVLVLALIGVACDAPPAAPSPAAAASSATAPASSIGSKPSAVVDDAFVTLARNARDAATALARECSFRSDGFDEFTPYYDTCLWTAPKLAAWAPAAAALRAAAARASGPLPADVASFVDQVRLFAEWVELVRNLDRQRGTLSHHQELVVAWNTWRPAEKVAIDAVSLRVRSGRPDAGVLHWDLCHGGPCVRDAQDPHPGRR